MVPCTGGAFGHEPNLNVVSVFPTGNFEFPILEYLECTEFLS